MKAVAGHKKLRFQELIQILLDILFLRMRNKNRNTVDATIDFTAQNIPELLKDFARQFTPYAYELVNAQRVMKTSAYNVVQQVLICHLLL